MQVFLRLDLANELVRQFASDLEPAHREAQKRIQQTTDRLNVTDRLLGYRNNLTRHGPAKPNQVKRSRYYLRNHELLSKPFSVNLIHMPA